MNRNISAVFWCKTGLIMAVMLLSACQPLTSLYFYPDTRYYNQPEDFGLTARRITLQTADGETLANWLLEAKGEPRARLLFLHGNGENISTHINSVAWLPEHGFQVFLLDYRGYGMSTGHATMQLTIKDIASAHRWLSSDNDLPLALFGQSMGGALAITYAAMADANLQPIEALVAESAPASWPQVAREVMSKHWLTWVLQAPAALMPSNLDAECHIGNLDSLPVLLMHSPDDRVVGYHHFEQLIEASSTATRVAALPTQGRHIAAFADPKVRQHFLDFLATHLGHDSTLKGP